MKLPFSWIKECLSTHLSAVEIADILTQLGLEVDGIERPNFCFNGVVVAKVLAAEPHPNADKLRVATVTDGKETLQVVCGASNCRAGLVTALAKVGATLSDKDGKVFAIKSTKLRGVDSFGMLCACSELGLPGDDSGIMELSEQAPLGTAVEDLYGDAVFEIGLTPNLGHCASLLGVLRELSAALDTGYSLPEVFLDQPQEGTAASIKVSVEDPQKCPRYACQVVRGVRVGPSPEWLQRRLEQCGQRSVNNVVDATNYVLWELGQPLHAFDLDKLAGGQIIVRSSHEGESFVTLDGQERHLPKDALLVCDAEKPVALAGIMGGQCSEVDDNTKNILLESAFFDPATTRRVCKALGLFTEASRRFERHTDPAGVVRALNRVAFLIREIAGGEIESAYVDCGRTEWPDQKLTVRLSRAQRLIGEPLTVDEVESIFRRLGFPCNWDGQDSFFVRVPAYRADISAEIDLVEEIARIYGYSNIQKRPAQYQCSTLPHAPMFMFEQLVRQKLLRAGLFEFITPDLIGPAALDALHSDVAPVETQVTVLNPTSVEQSILRQSLIPGMLQALKHNVDRKSTTIAAFEIGRAHLREGGKFKEHAVAGIVLTGLRAAAHWSEKELEYDFYDLKGLIEGLMQVLGVTSAVFVPSRLPSFHPGRQAIIRIGEVDVGMIGELHPEAQRKVDLSQRVLFAEINLHDLFPFRNNAVTMEPLPQFPASERDWTVTLDDSVAVGDVMAFIRSSAPSILEEAVVLDLYKSEKLGADKKNVTFRFVYRDRQKTLQQADVDAAHQQLIDAVIKQKFRRPN